MENPFQLSQDKLIILLKSHVAWLETEAKEQEYIRADRERNDSILKSVLNTTLLKSMSNDTFYEWVYDYSRKLEGPAHINLGEVRLRDELSNLRRNIEYICNSADDPFEVAQRVIEGNYKIDFFAKSFWTPILQARFPTILPNWNNKTEALFNKLGIKLSTSKLNVSDKYKLLAKGFSFLASIGGELDFFSINHLMHYGIVIEEGKKLLDDLIFEETCKTSRKIINENKFNEALQKYIYVCKNTDWLDVREAYKFKFGRWLNVRINFDTMSDQEILQLCRDSQEVKYDGKGKGVNFLVSAKRYKEDFIGIKDVEIFRTIHNRELINPILLGSSTLSYPKLSAWLATIFPNRFNSCPNSGIIASLEWLFDIDTIPKKGYKSFIWVQYLLEDLSQYLISLQAEIFPILLEKTRTREIVDVDIVWLIQDFILFIEREILSLSITSQIDNEDPPIETKTDMIVQQKYSLNQIFYGPPGTGKTFNTVNKALEIVNPSFKIENDREVVKAEYDKYVNNGQIVFTTFHQSMSYEDFVEGIKPQEPKEEGKPISYKVEEGIFRKICYKANPSYGNIENVIEEFKKEISEDDDKQPLTIKAKGTSFKVIYRGTSVFYVQPLASTKDKPWYPVNINNIYKAFETDNFDGIYNPTYVREIINFLQENRGLQKGSNQNQQNQQNLPYVLIIDEINRGNVSQILGELITLIEEDKRLGRKEALEITLPYSKEKFGVPSNLYIIGTMNTADRSVEALDTALRRRFTFREYMPDPKLIEKELGDKNIWNGFKLSDVLNTINKRIEVLLDRDHQIGHSYFLALANSSDFEAELKNVFTQRIIPLLQEYFYNDYVKIEMVLGAGFIVAEKRDKITFAKNSESLESDYADGYIYRLIQGEQINLSEALRILLNQPKDAE